MLLIQLQRCHYDCCQNSQALDECVGFVIATLSHNTDFLLTTDGSGQRAWSKLWIRCDSPFLHKTEYERHWPTPSHYQHRSLLGPKQTNLNHGFPSHSIGTLLWKLSFCIRGGVGALVLL